MKRDMGRSKHMAVVGASNLQRAAEAKAAGFDPAAAGGADGEATGEAKEQALIDLRPAGRFSVPAPTCSISPTSVLIVCRAKKRATANEESIIFWTLAFLPPARRSFSRDAPREVREGREGQGTVALRLDGAEKTLTIFFLKCIEVS